MLERVGLVVFCAAALCLLLHRQVTLDQDDRDQRSNAAEQQQQPEAEPTAANVRCHMHDQYSYCVYEHSLCIDQDGAAIVLATEDKAATLNNGLLPSPWHLPFAVPLQSLQGSVFDNRSPLPFRSFFRQARYGMWPPQGAKWLPGWSLAASFDDQGSNIYHFVNKMQAAWTARLYELEGLRDLSGGSFDSASMLNNLLGRNKGFDHAYVFRGKYSAWQAGFAEIALGHNVSTAFITASAHVWPVCFERAIIPGALLYLSDGLATSTLFREVAAVVKGIRVPAAARNVISIFHRVDKRAVVNMDEVEAACKEMGEAKGLTVERIHFTADTPFETQALQMARTKIYVTTHGSVLNHCIFMEPGDGVVIELNPYQFLYPLDQQIIVNRGMYYFRHEATLKDTATTANGAWGHDAFPGLSAKACFEVMHSMCAYLAD